VDVFCESLVRLPLGFGLVLWAARTVIMEWSNCHISLKNPKEISTEQFQVLVSAPLAHRCTECSCLLFLCVLVTAVQRRATGHIGLSARRSLEGLKTKDWNLAALIFPSLVWKKKVIEIWEHNSSLLIGYGCSEWNVILWNTMTV